MWTSYGRVGGCLLTPAEVLARFPPLTPEQAAEVEALRAQRAVVNRRIDRVRRLIARLKALEEPLVLQEGELWAMMLDADYATRARNHIASDLARGSYTRDGRLYTLVCRERDGMTDHIIGAGAKKRRWYTGFVRADGPGRWRDGRGDIWVEVTK